jgi:NAD(P)-dependent dehydrogenase (short-subunit alcohol dehydrogenase family)
MRKTILITGSTDGIGLLTANSLAEAGHKVLLHGRNARKLEAALAEVGGNAESVLADLSDLRAVSAMAAEVRNRCDRLDVLINNAGVLRAPETVTSDGLDVRFAVNAIAPYLLTKELLPIVPKDGRVINLSSAAQARVNVDGMAGKLPLDEMGAYAQSKLALTIWSQELARGLPDGPVIVAVNPGSLLASKMVKEGFGVAGNDLDIGANILCRAALDAEFADASGKYFDNDSGRFAAPNAAAGDAAHSAAVMQGIEEILAGV